MNDSLLMALAFIGIAGPPNPFGDFVVATAQMIAGIAGWQAMRVRRSQRVLAFWCGQCFLGASVWICARQYAQAALDADSTHWIAELAAGRAMLLMIRAHWVAGFLLLLRINWVDRCREAERDTELLTLLDRIKTEGRP